MKTFLGVLAALLAVILILLLLAYRAPEPSVTNGDNGTNGTSTDMEPPQNGEDEEDENRADQALDVLPLMVSAGPRSVAIDRGSVPQEPREEYSFREASTLPRAGESPTGYIARLIGTRLEREEVVEETEFYEYTASMYTLDENRIAAFVRVSDLPDDSVGAEEERFEFVFEDGEWVLDWYGLRRFCRRPAQEFWTPADELCP